MKYAKKVNGFVKSEIRNKLFDTPGLISFAAGKPDASGFPFDELSAALEKISADQNIQQQCFQYSSSDGILPLRESIANILMKENNVTAAAENIILTSGSQQGIYYSTQLFANEGDVVLCEDPSYTGALNIFSSLQVKPIGIPMEPDGMNMDILEQKLKEYPQAKMIYTIPDFQNPTGIILSLEKRKRLAALSEKYDIPVIEDAPYGELTFGSQKLPPVKSFDRCGNTVYLGTFSKVLCPGLRVGWICANPDVVEKYYLLKMTSDLQCGTLNQILIQTYLENTDWKKRLCDIRNLYQKKRDIMIECMQKEFPSSVRYTIPQGGFFVWLELDEKYDTKELQKKAIEKNRVAFIPGQAFFPSQNKKNYIRLSYSNVTEDGIREGIARLGAFLKNLIKEDGGK